MKHWKPISKLVSALRAVLISKLLKNKEILFIILAFLIWRIYLFFALFLSFIFLPLAGNNFLGGGLGHYLQNPAIFAWANFDGEHYLSIAQIGYRGLEQAFFPIYPGLMHFFANPFGINITSLAVSGFFISNVSIICSLVVLWKLLKLDYNRNLAILTIILILTFPTSFYFGAVYSESLFLLLSLLSFYFARKNKWFLAGIFGVICSATRIFGILLLPALFLEAWQQRKSWKEVFGIVFIPLGLGVYMIYQWMAFADPLAFYHLQKIVGPQHESGIILLPQVYFRYLKMLLIVDMSNPIFKTTILEFVVGILFFILPIMGYFKKVRLSYLFYAMVGFLLPTIQGSFSSLPRYVLVFFPSFLCLAIILQGTPRIVKLVSILILIFLLALETMLFLRGYWIA